MGLISGSQGWFNICKSISVIHHINKRKDKNHMIISIDAGNVFDKIQHPFMIKKKTSHQSGYRGNISQYNKRHLWPTDCQHNTQWWKLKAFPLKSGTSQGCPLSPLWFNIVLEVLTTAIRQEKEIKGIQIGREDVKCHYMQMTWHNIENPKEFTPKLLELKNEFSKVAEYKIKIQKICCIYLHQQWNITERK